jgi:FAD/FMN-containing dehydrogenase
MKEFLSWGRYPLYQQQSVSIANRLQLASQMQNALKEDSKSILPYGQGRSYGDVCLNGNQQLVLSKNLDNLISFNRETGILRAESGITLAKLLDVIVPAGYFLPVTPGTKYVSLGGAVANDVHGKNHHCAGTFGTHIRALKIWRSDRGFVECTADSDAELFYASIAGLGLTGFITEVEIQLKKIDNHLIDIETHCFNSLDQFFELSSRLSQVYEYTVAWLDCLSTGNKEGRGVFFCGRHAKVQNKKIALKRKKIPLGLPFAFPRWVLNQFSMRCFNEFYFRLQSSKTGQSQVHYDPFFYPLDGVANWNKMYGNSGFAQFQCVLPKANNHAALRRLLKLVSASKSASFLTVLKEFGELTSPGLLSFPREGDTICLDFSLKNPKVFQLMKDLDAFVCSEGGALYPAKDAFMSAESFKQFYPQWAEFKKYIDPSFSSSFWRRVVNE